MRRLPANMSQPFEHVAMNLAIRKNTMEDYRELPGQEAALFDRADLVHHAVHGEEVPQPRLPLGAGSGKSPERHRKRPPTAAVQRFSSTCVCLGGVAQTAGYRPARVRGSADSDEQPGHREDRAQR